MQNTYQEDWAERSLFYNCRMFTEGFKKGDPYWKLSSCIHIGILNFNMMKSPGYYHKVTLRDEKTNELYSRKFQFHVIELSKIETTKGNHYMEKVRDEMIKMSRDESERYLYLREQMAIRDKASQLRSAENRGRREGELLKLILQIQKKIQKNKELHQIADEVEEEVIKIQPIYEAIKEHPEADKEEIYKMLK